MVKMVYRRAVVSNIRIVPYFMNTFLK